MSAKHVLVAGVVDYLILMELLFLTHNSGIYIDGNTVGYSLGAIFAAAIGLSIVGAMFNKRFRTLGFYSAVSTLIFLFILSLITFESPTLLAFSFISFAILFLVYYDLYFRERENVYKVFTFIGILALLYSLSGEFKIEIPGISVYDAAFALYANSVPGGGIPFLMWGAVSVFSKTFVADVSVGYSSLVLFIGAVLTENYFQIFKVLNRSTADRSQAVVSGLATVLSCQCETIASALPTLLVLVVLTAIIPIMAESILLVVLTYITLRYFYNTARTPSFVHTMKKKISDRTVVFLAPIIIIVPIFEIIGVYLKLIHSIFFFFGTSFLMLIAGMLIMIIVGQVMGGKKSGLHNMTHYTVPFLGAIALMVVWFFPSLSRLAYLNTQYYALMNITGVISGVLFGYIFTHVRTSRKPEIIEFISMMPAFIGLVFFYITKFDVLLWTEFGGLNQQLYFGIALLAASIPVMWISTQYVLSDAISEKEDSSSPNVLLKSETEA